MRLIGSKLADLRTGSSLARAWQLHLEQYRVPSELIHEVNCPRCGSHHKKPVLEREGLRIVWCKDCGIGYTDRRWTDAGLRRYYQEGYFKGGVPGAYMDYQQEEAEKKVDFLAKYAWIKSLRAEGRVLDVGCATGVSLIAAGETGFKPHGIEISEWAYENRCTNLPMKHCGLLEMETKKPFDIITMWDVIEHLADPAPSFKKLATLLKPGGLLVFTYPDAGTGWARVLGARWGVLVPQEHYLFFASRQIRAWLREYGFHLVQERVERRIFTLRKFMQQALSTNPQGKFGDVQVSLSIPYKKIAVYKLKVLDKIRPDPKPSAFPTRRA
ncbi:MAG TPA: methyltransferase domain-containing protein [Candidatus Xenobia bacterium]|jgi:SAM-dependent methyltransferase